MESIRSYDYINHPFEVVREALIKDAASIFSSATKSASKRASDVVSELKVNLGGIEIGTDISIDVKVLEDYPKQKGLAPVLVLELEWKSTHLPAFFPVMHGKLSVYPLTHTETQLDFSGRYDKPLGILGSAIDAMAGRRVADASIDRFVKDTASYLRESLGEVQAAN